MNRVEQGNGQFLRNFPIARYACVGGIAFVVDWTMLCLLTEALELHYLVGATAGFVCGLVLNYIFCLSWVFAGHTVRSHAAEFTVFAIIGAVGLLLNDLLMWLFTEVGHLIYFQSKVAAAGLVFFWNYFARKHSLFSTDNTKLGRDYACR